MNINHCCAKQMSLLYLIYFDILRKWEVLKLQNPGNNEVSYHHMVIIKRMFFSWLVCVKEEACSLFALEVELFKFTLVRFLRRIKGYYCLWKRNALVEPGPQIVFLEARRDCGSCLVWGFSDSTFVHCWVQLLVLAVSSAFIISSKITLFAINQTVWKKSWSWVFCDQHRHYL